MIFDIWTWTIVYKKIITGSFYIMKLKMKASEPKSVNSDYT